MPEAEHRLLHDLSSLEERFADEKFAAEVYRALTERRWYRPGEPEMTVALSWRRAAEVVNGLRRDVGKDELPLFQSGREGELSNTVRDELGRLGWESEPLDTSRHDEAHVTDPPSAPPPETGARQKRDRETPG
jgi:hypothetical protein